MEGNSRRKKNIGVGEAEEAELKNRDDDKPQLLGEIMDAVNDIADMNNNMPNFTLDQRVAMLNNDQKRIYDKIKQHLTKQKQQEDLSSDNDVKIDDIQPLRMFVSVSWFELKMEIIIIMEGTMHPAINGWTPLYKTYLTIINTKYNHA